MTEDESTDFRIYGCDIIQNAGILLKLPQVAMSTAQMLFQRVYHTTNYTFENHPLDITAMSAMFLASKIEECPRKIREVIDVFTYVISKKSFKTKIIELTSSEHETLREELITAERRLLKNLGFNLLSSYPHKILVSYYQVIVHALDPEHHHWSYHKNQKLLQIAWNYCNDSLKLDIFIKHSKEVVACACIQMACEQVGMSFPRSTDGREWYELFVEDVRDVQDAMKMLSDLYQRKAPDPQKFERYIHLMKFHAY